ncbi:MAG: 2-C-methyl-D-erythritol 4-phosphate cytidylyltransferase [Pseudomonadota bacterium]
MTSERFFGLIPAAGEGSRMGEARPKQYLLLSGRPMLYHSVHALLECGRIDTVFVVLSPDDGEFRRHAWGEFGERMAPLYCGGATRHDSVLNGLIAAASTLEPDDWVLVHDAARPCLGQRELLRMIDALAVDEVGGILAVPVADTLKRADQAGRIQATESREHLWQAQTPQMFRYGLLLRALSRTAKLTDEAGAVEALGLTPKLVHGSNSNLKVTHPEDLQLAQSILASRGRQT